ncbi:MAG: rRNA maturation RNase YbeY [Usitatibacter sp.]
MLQIQRASRLPHLPSDRKLRAWSGAALVRKATVTVRIVNAAEGRRLNRQFRGRDYATNVLTFVYESGRSVTLSGDVVICAPVVARESREQGKTLEAHYAHLLVHGLLHLQGMDHEASAVEAERMERRERSILRRLGFPDPYAAI